MLTAPRLIHVINKQQIFCLLLLCSFANILPLVWISGRSKGCQTCRDINFPATIPMDETMPPRAELYFEDPLDHLKKFYKISEFQRQQKDIFYKQSKHQINQVSTICKFKR